MTRLNFLGQRSSARFLIAATALVASGAVAAQDRTEWMPHARWGVMTHYLADWRMQVDRTPLSVDVWRLLRVARLSASWATLRELRPIASEE